MKNLGLLEKHEVSEGLKQVPKKKISGIQIKAPSPMPRLVNDSMETVHNNAFRNPESLTRGPQASLGASQNMLIAKKAASPEVLAKKLSNNFSSALNAFL